ncbi:MAG: hypothetical protein GC201_16600 [Alphaproteobacteria bacterium]|nr:hypothetical protein [Alphaproteobacteria bacterium]
MKLSMIHAAALAAATALATPAMAAGWGQQDNSWQQNQDSRQQPTPPQMRAMQNQGQRADHPTPRSPQEQAMHRDGQWNDHQTPRSPQQHAMRQTREGHQQARNESRRVRRALQAAGIDRNVNIHFSAYDRNGDGALNPMEFALALRGGDHGMSSGHQGRYGHHRHMNPRAETNLLNRTAWVFSNVDENHDHKVTRRELRDASLI